MQKYVLTFEQFISEDMRILKDKPKWFYLVLHIKRSWDSLISQKFDGVVGISDNPNIINAWMDVRDTLLVMDAEEFLKLNPSLTKIDYNNPNQLVSNNFSLLKRLIQDRPEDKRINRAVQSIFSHAERADKTQKYYKVIKFLNGNLYEFVKIVEQYIKSDTINNLWDFTNVIWNNMIDVVRIYNKNYSYSKPYEEKHLVDKNTLYYIFQKAILYIAEEYQHEGEWLIKPDKITGERILNIPDNSKLYFKLTVTDPEESDRYKSTLFKNGLNSEDTELITDMIDQYGLDKIYDVNFVEGHLKLFDIWKDQPSPNVIPYSKLMKTPKGFPKKKVRK